MSDPGKQSPVLQADSDLLLGFIDEALETLDGLDRLFVDLEQTHDVQIIQAIFRPVHSIKGNAAFFGLSGVRGLAHDLETILDQARRGQREITGGISDLLLAGLDALKEMLRRSAEGLAETPDPAATDRLRESLRSAIQPVDACRSQPTLALHAGLHHPITAALEAIAQGKDAVLRHLDQLPAWASLPQGQAAVAAFRTDLAAILDAADWSDVTIDLLRDQLPRLYQEHLWQAPSRTPPGPAAPGPGHASVPEANPPPPHQLPALIPRGSTGNGPGGHEAGTSNRHSRESAAGASDRIARDDQAIRVPMAQIDGFLGQVGELLVLGDLLTHIEGRLEHLSGAEDSRRDLRQALAIYSQVTTGMRQSVIALRQVSAKRLFQKVPRLVRDVASNRGKEITVDLTGEEVALDKAILDLLDAPLVHLVRNAADHGIELPAQRRSLGKSPTGTIQVTLRETDTALVLMVADDGAGLNLERIRAKAIENGLIATDAVLGREDIINFIFASGVSTATEITDVSGRGVGLDVVRKAIENAGGRIEIDTREGRGTTFTIQVPKAARTEILAGFLVGTGAQTYILPLDRIERAVAFTADQVRRMPDGGTRLLIDGQTLPHHTLAELVGQGGEAAAITVLLRLGTERHSVAVDAVLGVRQVLVRRIESRRCGALVAGGAVMGDGKVAVVLDPDRLLAS